MRTASRRGFLRQLAFGRGPVSSDADAHTLVCIFLRGGADTLNFLVPYGDDHYYKRRPTLAIPPPAKGRESKEAAIRLDDFYALHPKLAPIGPIYKEGRLAWIQAVGTDNPTGSHFEAQDQMEHGEAYGEAVGGGWLGRHLQTRIGVEPTPLSAVAIGPTIPESLRGAVSVSALSGLEELRIQAPTGDAQAAARALAAMYGAEVGLLSRPGRATLDLLQRVEALRETEYKPEGNAQYPKHPFGAGLREIARLVKAEVGLEVACIDMGGWDTHFFQGTVTGAQAESADYLACGLAAFDADLKPYRERVTTLVMTEFGRRLYENGSLGTDHGRGFAMMAMGSRIHGGRVHGPWPGLEEEGLLGPGGLRIQYDYRSVLAEVLTGVLNNRKIEKVFPGFQPQTIGLVKRFTGTGGRGSGV